MEKICTLLTSPSITVEVCLMNIINFYHEAYDVLKRYMYVLQFSPLPKYFKNMQYVNNIEY